MENLVSVSTENFIKVIYNFENRQGWDTRPGTIARELKITNAAATDMARKLSHKKLIEYKKYKALKLTPAGKRMALEILRKHRLWETFLHRIFGLSMHEIHREAEMLEHFTSDFLAEKISMYLGNPTTDPHGDPIPDKYGEFLSDKESVILSMAEPEIDYQVTRLSASDKEFFDFCHSNHIMVGSVLSVKKQYHQNKMTEIEFKNTKLLLHSDLAGTIFVKKMS